MHQKAPAICRGLGSLFCKEDQNLFISAPQFWQKRGRGASAAAVHPQDGQRRVGLFFPQFVQKFPVLTVPQLQVHSLGFL